MANYLILCVNSDKAQQVEKWFARADEQDKDLLTIEVSGGKRCFYFANQGKLDKTIDGGVFKGYAIDHDRQELIYSGSWATPNVNRALPGCYIRLQRDLDALVVGNDLFAQLPMIYYSEGGVVAISDSVFILTALRREFGLRNRVNLDAALSRAWIHGMGAQLMGTGTLIEGISYCTPGSKIRISGGSGHISADLEKILMPDLFSDHVTDYRDSLIKGTKRIAAVVATMPTISGSHTTVQVSGGIDSRIGLAAALMQPDHEDCSFTTNKAHAEDYAAAYPLADKFKFTYGTQKPLEHRHIEQIPSWMLSSAGICDLLAAPVGTPLEPAFTIGGNGAEVYKGLFRWRRISAMTPDRVGHVAGIQRRKEQLELPSFLHGNQFFIRHLKKFILKNKVKVGVDISEAAYRECAQGLHSVGISPENPWASEWHYLCFKNAIDSGRFTMASLLDVRPLLQEELVGLAYSKLNPYPAPVDGSPSVVTDMLIALNPELAMMPFDDPRKNMTKEYVQERSKYLGRVEKVEPYAVVGHPTRVNSGTPGFFIKLVRERGFEGNFTHDAIKKLALAGYESVPASIRHAYEFPRFLVEKELPDRITGVSWHCKTAGKLMAFSLAD
jgi:hypothetical protein